MVFVTPTIELILPSKCYISRQYSHKNILKILKISIIMNFLVKNVDFPIIFASVFFSELKLKKIIAKNI